LPLEFDGQAGRLPFGKPRRAEAAVETAHGPPGSDDVMPSRIAVDTSAAHQALSRLENTLLLSLQSSVGYTAQCTML